MTEAGIIDGKAAALRIANLDTDQIMPKQFLRGIDKSGLSRGLLYDLRFDADGNSRPEFILNRPAYAGTNVLIAGPNFGCGSSREHAVWGLQQFGIQAVIAPGFGEIFYSNALNNRLVPIALPEDTVRALMREADAAAGPLPIVIDIRRRTVRSRGLEAAFHLADRHRRMLLEGLDVIGASLLHRGAISATAERIWSHQPWLKDVAQKTRERLATRLP